MGFSLYLFKTLIAKALEKKKNKQVNNQCQIGNETNKQTKNCKLQSHSNVIYPVFMIVILILILRQYGSFNDSCKLYYGSYNNDSYYNRNYNYQKIYSGCCHCFHWLQNWKPLRKVLKIFSCKSVVQHQLTNPIKQIKIHFSPTHSP